MPSAKDFDYQIKYQRAFDAVLWNMPAVAIYAFRRAAFNDLGAKDNDIIAYSALATPKLEAVSPPEPDLVTSSAEINARQSACNVFLTIGAQRPTQTY